jgi:pilus assembly protein Flp/PilA
MLPIKQYLTDLYRDEQGLTTVEYAIAGGLVGAAVVGSFTSLGTTLAAKIAEIITALA